MSSIRGLSDAFAIRTTGLENPTLKLPAGTKKTADEVLVKANEELKLKRGVLVRVFLSRPP